MTLQIAKENYAAFTDAVGKHKLLYEKDGKLISVGVCCLSRAWAWIHGYRREDLKKIVGLVHSIFNDDVLTSSTSPKAENFSKNLKIFSKRLRTFFDAHLGLKNRVRAIRHEINKACNQKETERRENQERVRKFDREILRVRQEEDEERIQKHPPTAPLPIPSRSPARDSAFMPAALTVTEDEDVSMRGCSPASSISSEKMDPSPMSLSSSRASSRSSSPVQEEPAAQKPLSPIHDNYFQEKRVDPNDHPRLVLVDQLPLIAQSTPAPWVTVREDHFEFDPISFSKKDTAAPSNAPVKPPKKSRLAKIKAFFSKKAVLKR